MFYFLEKAGKIAAALGAPPPNPRWLPAAPRPPSCYSHSISMLFSALRKFLSIVKITAYSLLE